MNKRHLGIAGAGIALASSIGVVADPPPASAALHPPGCNSWTVFSPFSQNCWLSQSASHISANAGFIYGIQWAVAPMSDPSYAPTWNYTQAMAKYVAAYQSSKGLSADSIVGTNTWTALQGSLIPEYCGSFGSNRNFYSDGSCVVETPTFFISTVSGRWYTMKRRNGTWAEPPFTPNAAYGFNHQQTITT